MTFRFENLKIEMLYYPCASQKDKQKGFQMQLEQTDSAKDVPPLSCKGIPALPQARKINSVSLNFAGFVLCYGNLKSNTLVRFSA